MVKFSLLFQYRRIFETPQTRDCFSGFLPGSAFFSAVALGLTIFTCVPVNKYWDDSTPGGCIDRQLLHYLIAGINIFNDFTLLIVPVPFLRKLKIARKSQDYLDWRFHMRRVVCSARLSHRASLLTSLQCMHRRNRTLAFPVH